MGKAEKKHGKGRLDEYYHKAKQKGYRARSSFKILQINEEFGHFLERSKVVIDLCAAPGSWCQVAIQKCPIGSLIIGVDLAPIKPLPNVITFQSDITTEHCRTTLKKHMKHAKADTVMHDGAPNVGLAWGQDAYTQSELTLQSLKLAVEFLVPGGTFVTKIFRSRDYNKMFWVMQQMFGHVKAYKPKSSRNVSAEVFLVCQNFKNAKIDPKMLDSKYVFEELEDSAPNYNAKVFNPDKKRRHRDGYDENETHFHEMSAMEFIKHEDPIKCLGSMNRIVFDTEAEPELKAIKKLSKINDRTNELDKTSELLRCFDDLKILGKKEFRNILKWRNNMREYLKLDGDDEEEQVEVEELDEDEKITQELSEIQERERLKRKRTKRKANELKQKEILKRQLNMTTPTELGMEAGVNGDSLFNLRKAEKTGELSSLIKGKKAMVFDEKENDDIVVSENEEDQDSDAYAENLETQLDSMYDALKERKAARDAKFRAKMNRERSTVEDDEFTGFSERDDSDSEDVREDDQSDSDLDTEDEEDLDKLITNLRSEKADLSGKAKRFFDNPLFQDDADEEDGSEEEEESTAVSKPEPMDVDEVEDQEEEEQSTTQSASEVESDTDESEDDFEVVANDADSDDDWEYRNNDKTQRQTVDIATAEAMTMAHDLALGKNKHKWMDEAGFNKYSFRDSDGLPQWFLDDEKRHNKITRPVSKEAVEALRQKQKTMNARPIKKVAEAQARKKYKAQKRLEKIRKKSDLIIDDANKSEREKADEVQRLIKKLGKKQIKKPKVTLVSAKGANRALQGRPKGVKGKYKMVDGTMKKEQRALKRIAKKRK